MSASYWIKTPFGGLPTGHTMGPFRIRRHVMSFNDVYNLTTEWRSYHRADSNHAMTRNHINNTVNENNGLSSQVFVVTWNSQ
jgi:hypothetical protein